MRRSSLRSSKLMTWWRELEAELGEDEGVWVPEAEGGVGNSMRRQAADPVIDMLLKSLRVLTEYFFNQRGASFTISQALKKAMNYSEFEKLFRVEQDARPWAQLARTAHLMRLVRRCLIYIKVADGGDAAVSNEYETEFSDARAKRIKRLKEWRQDFGESAVHALSETEKRELWTLLSYSLARSEAVSAQRRQSNLINSIDGELSEAEVAETNMAIEMLKKFGCGKVPACFVPSYEVTISQGSSMAYWGDVEVFVRAIKWGAESDELPTDFGEEEMLRRSDMLTDLHHPNIAQFFGMCHVGGTRLELYEKLVENEHFNEKGPKVQWDIWRSCALVLHYLLERGMSYDKFSRDKVFKAHTQDKYVLLGTGILANELTDPSAFPERFFENMKAFASMIVEDVGEMFNDDVQSTLISSVESGPPEIMERSTWNMLQLFCTSCLSEQKNPSLALFALGEIVRKEGTYADIMNDGADDSIILTNSDQPIDQVKAAIEQYNFDYKPFEAMMDDLNKQCGGNDLSENDRFIFDKIKCVYERLQVTPSPLSPLVIKAYLRALERFFALLDAKRDTIDESARNEVFILHSNIQFTVLKTLESIFHALNTGGAESFASLRSWRATFRENFTSQLENEDETELINLFERTKRAGYCFDCISFSEPDQEKGLTLPRWFIPPYEIEVTDAVDSGGFAVVNRGKWFYTEVVVKRVFADQHHSVCETCHDNFRREANIWFSLTHPNVIKLYGASSVSTSMLFVCEYARNGHLMNFIETKKEKDVWCSIWRLLKEAAVALEYQHARGYIHRDLKCDNILVGNDGCARLADFGLSTSHSEQVKTPGAKNFKAPEVLKGSTPSAASDVFSLGKCVEEAIQALYENSEGHNNGSAIRTALSSQTYTDLISSMTHKEPEKRLRMFAVILQLQSSLQAIEDCVLGKIILSRLELLHAIDGVSKCLLPPPTQQLLTAVRRDLQTLIPTLLDEFLSFDDVHFLAKRMQTRELMSAAAFAGNVELLEVLYTRFGCMIDHKTFENSATGGHVEAYEWVRDRLNGHEGHEPQYSDFDLWIMHKEELIGAVAKGGNTEMTLAVVRERYLKANNPRNDSFLDFRVAVRYGHHNVVEGLRKEFTEPPNWVIEDEMHTDPSASKTMLVYNSWRDVCGGCRASSVPYFSPGLHICPIKRIIDAAAAGRLDFVIWFFENRAEHIVGTTDNAMDIAATNGHLNVVSWLHDNSDQTCTTAAMNGAANNNHLNAVRFLHKNRAEGCTADALDGAASNGHIEIVRFLLDHRTEGCTSVGADAAATNGHLEVARLLHSRQAAVLTCNALDGAAANGHLEVVKWLLRGDCIDDNAGSCHEITATMDQAAINGHLAIVKCLDGYESSGNKKTHGCSGAALIGGTANQHIEVVLWLLEQKPEVCFGEAPIASACKDLTKSKMGHVPSSIEVATERAAANGHLSMVQLLHNYEFSKIALSTRCSSEALSKIMHYASSTGKVSVVMWAYQQLEKHRACYDHERSNLCDVTSNEALVTTLNTAVQTSQIIVTRWAHSRLGNNANRAIKNSSFDKGFVAAAQNADFDMLEWIRARYELKPAWVQLGASAAAQRGHLEVLQWLSIQVYTQIPRGLRPGDTPWGRLACISEGTGFVRKWLEWFEDECGPVHLELLQRGR